MTIHKEGYTSLILTVSILLVFNSLVHFFLGDIVWLKWIIYTISILLFAIVLQFFRNPSIEITKNEGQILCSADGKVVVIEETMENEYFKDKRIQVSVFMSPFNVHSNRNPISGTVKFFKYHPGLFLVAWYPKSSTENERTTIVVEHQKGFEILYRQIAGALARRIVWYVKEGDKVEQGKEFGFIKFGSRVDIFLPLNAKVKVGLNEVVKSGKTVIAEF